MNKIAIIAALLLGANVAHAAVDKAALAAAKTDYAADRKLCADLPTSNERLACLKDAKVKYEGAVKAAKNAPATPAAATGAKDEGKVLGVKVVEKEGEGSGVGIIAGGAAGALLGHQVGGGTGKDLATIAGAAGGAYAGHQVEKKVKASKTWVVSVKFNDGKEQSFNFDKDPGYGAGTVVKRAGESIQRK